MRVSLIAIRRPRGRKEGSWIEERAQFDGFYPDHVVPLTLGIAYGLQNTISLRPQYHTQTCKYENKHFHLFLIHPPSSVLLGTPVTILRHLLGFMNIKTDLELCLVDQQAKPKTFSYRAAF